MYSRLIGHCTAQWRQIHLAPVLRVRAVALRHLASKKPRRNIQQLLEDKRERGKQMVADLTQRGVIKTGATLTDVIHAPAAPTVVRGRLKARDAPKKEIIEPVQDTLASVTAAKNSAAPITAEHTALVEHAEQLPMPEEVPLPNHSLNQLQSRVAEFISLRYRQYPLPFMDKELKKLPRTMLKPATHAEFLAHWSQSFAWDEHVTQLNTQVFNNAIFRPYQREAVNIVLARLNLLCCLPTGGGKSLVYQLPGLLARGTTIVISPLLALIQDQTSQLAKKGISVRAITSQVPPNEISAIYREMSRPDFDVKFLYVTPERIAQSERFMEALQSLHKYGNLRSIAVDEAHCISEWGHDFRPDYRRLSMLRQTFPEVPVIAVTGTCTPTVRDDIISQLQLGDTSAVIQTSFNRPNIWLEVRPKGEEVRYDVYKYICSNNLEQQCGIVYCLTCKDAEGTAEYLQKCGLKAEYYHGGLTAARRHSVQQQWMSNECHVMCTTVAFGLGIDKHDVRYVVHSTMPLSLEAYYQQVGRAGRDHVLAWAVLFYRARDRLRIDHVISANSSTRAVMPTAAPARDTHDAEHVTVEDADVSYEDTTVDYNVKAAKAEKLDDIEKFCQNSSACRRQMLLSYFGEQFSAHNCKENCDVCAQAASMGDESRARLHSRKRFTFASKMKRKIFAKNSAQSGKEFELIDENDPQFKEKQRLIAAKGAEIAEEEELERKKREVEFKEKMRQKFEEKRQRLATRRLTRVKRAPRVNTETDDVSEAEETVRESRAFTRKPVRSVKLLSKDPTVIQLHEICSEIASSRGVSVARVLSDTAMRNIAKNRPKTFSELSAITGKQKAALLSNKILRLFKDD